MKKNKLITYILVSISNIETLLSFAEKKIKKKNKKQKNKNKTKKYNWLKNINWQWLSNNVRLNTTKHKEPKPALRSQSNFQDIIHSFLLKPTTKPST